MDCGEMGFDERGLRATGVNQAVGLRRCNHSTPPHVRSSRRERSFGLTLHLVHASRLVRNAMKSA